MDWVETAENNAVYEVILHGERKRLKEAILYVCKKAEGMPRFGAIKLNKILWRADFRSYYEREVPVTGRQYQRLELGPAPVEMPPVVLGLLREGLLRIDRVSVAGKVEHRHIALADPVLQFFSPQDIDYLDEAIAHYYDMSGSESSDESHGVAWRTRSNGDPMPYQLAFLDDNPLPVATMQRAVELARERGWRSE